MDRGDIVQGEERELRDMNREREEEGERDSVYVCLEADRFADLETEG